jgi:hypothetical protein
VLRPLATALDRCRAVLAHAPGRSLVFGLVAVVFATQLLLQMHATRHELLPGVHQVCEQCVTAEHGAPLAAAAPTLPPSVARAAPVLDPRPSSLSRAPLTVRSRAPPSVA